MAGADAVWASEAPSKKSSAASPLIAFQSLRQPVWAPRDMSAFAREGYMQNPIVYRCVRMIADACASIPLLLYSGDHEIETHPLLDLLRRPNPTETGADLIAAFLSNLLVSGNAYLEAAAIDGAIRELHVLRPDRVRVVPSPDGWPEAWDYTVAGRTVRIAAEPVPGMRPVLHMKLFHAADDHYGMSPLEPAAAAVDLHNTATRWNQALLDNSARPSGALVYTARDGNLTGEQYERLKSELEAGFQGSANAGRPLLLEGGLDWKSMSLSPKDLDFNEARHGAAREIALALGVPPMLLGIPGDNTYSNLAEAQRIFWRQTVLPLAEKLTDALSIWLATIEPDLAFQLDLDNLPALSSERDALWTILEKTTFLTTREKRAAAGFTPTPGKTEIKYDPAQPRVPAGSGSESGRWTSSGVEGADPEGGWQLLLVSDSGRPVDLAEEEARGGHTIAKHVGKSEEFLLNRVRTEVYRFGFVTVGLRQAGSFPSLEAANKLVNSTLSSDTGTVERVASGDRPYARIEKEFGSPTGYEAYRRNDRAQAYMRDTDSVRVVIVHAPEIARGYRVITAFPRRKN